MADTNEVAKLIELTRDINITMFTTVDEEGHFVSRPMAQHLVEPDGDMWFFAERDSRVDRADRRQSARRTDPELQRHLDLDRRLGRDGRGPGQGGGAVEHLGRGVAAGRARRTRVWC